MRCENFAQSTFYTFFHLRQCREQVHFGGQRVCCGRHHHRKVYIRLVVVRPLPFEDFTSVVKEVAKQGNDFRTLNKVLAEDDMDEVLKHYYIRVGGNLRALDFILEDVSGEGQKGADAVIKQVEQWYKERVEPIEKKLDDQEVKDYLFKVAEAGPMGYLPNSKH